MAPRSVPVPQTQQPTTPEEIENQAFQQNKFEATKLQLKEKSGSITPVEQQNLGILQAKMDSFWAQRMERTKAQPNLLEILTRNGSSTSETPATAPIQTKPTTGQVDNTIPATIQAKLTVGQPNDQYEQEADRVAEQVMRMPDAPPRSIQREMTLEEEEIQTKPLARLITPLVQREEMQEEKELLQTQRSLQRATDGSLQAGENVESQLNSSKGGGSPLPEHVRTFMEPRFGADFSAVKVHTDSAAVQMSQALGAQAFTHGNDVYYGAGKSPDNNALTAHELTHVVQQTGSQVRRSPQPFVIRRAGDATPTQSTAGLTGDLAGDLDILYKQAAEAQEELYAKVTTIASETGGEPKLPETLKGRERAIEKTMADYKGDASKLVDLVRGSIVYESYYKLMEGLDSCNQNLTLVREKNRFDKPAPSGYRDILLNVKLSNGHIAELQLHLTQILAVKSGGEHKIYEEVRKIQAIAKTADRALTGEERAKIEQLNAESKALYEQALASAKMSK